ncbi:Putative 115 kDa protein in type-1 retrotransposable element R1DM [Eumeta japonica]|uniref:115 kDa protein in type-1 retrotransposable element R1DM n=1 Tax=Eumeta variegata TaxID=151549 RepID=A0A4C2A790_EUMVA|nr:Putative 115 kDa protein in type-1 retrotransposable element R1DM [Eumeta japonica]
MYRKCIAEGVFPDVWKAGRLVVLPKGGDRPASDPKAYRPLTLLPIMGKLLERIVVKCLGPGILHSHSAQHGFTRGRSTASALTEITGAVRASASKYVQLIFLDISCAFDNAWWPMILIKLKLRGCPPNLYKLMTDYFTDRCIYLVDRWWPGRGRRLPIPDKCKLIAYADDVMTVIEGDSRAEIERTGSVLLEAVAAWGRRNQQAFSPQKSRTMTARGRL